MSFDNKMPCSRVHKKADFTEDIFIGICLNSIGTRNSNAISDPETNKSINFVRIRFRFENDFESSLLAQKINYYRLNTTLLERKNYIGGFELVYNKKSISFLDG